MDEKRKGEIALALLKLKLRKDGVKITPDMRREFGDIAKTTCFHIDEIAEFIEIMVREMVDEMFAKPARK